MHLKKISTRGSRHASLPINILLVTRTCSDVFDDRGSTFRRPEMGSDRRGSLTQNRRKFVHFFLCMNFVECLRPWDYLSGNRPFFFSPKSVFGRIMS